MIEYISVRGLNKSYAKRQVVRDISFSVLPGEIFTLLGVDGAGKTTIIECISGLRKPDTGDITVYWMDVSQNRHAVQNAVGFLLNGTSLPDYMTVREAMQLCCAWHKTEYREELLQKFDLSGEYIDKPYDSLTETQKRMLHLAMALCHDPKILILDEPAAGLDSKGKNFLYEELKKLKADGVCILMATSDMAEAEKLSDKIAIIKEGQLIRITKPAELSTQNAVKTKVLIKTFEGCLKKELPLELGTPDVLDDGYLSFTCFDIADLLINVLSYIKKCGDTVTDIKVKRGRKEDILLSEMGGES